MAAQNATNQRLYVILLGQEEDEVEVFVSLGLVWLSQ
jgi:hypothetical protein